MKLRQMATAFIYNDGHVLMMKKQQNKLFDFEFWTAIGGHMEPLEINDPQKAVLREIEEESGLKESDIAYLELKYILKRRKNDEIRIQYVFFGPTLRKEVIESDEGELYWIAEKDVCELKLSTIIKETFRHYLSNREQRDINIGVITTEGNTGEYKMQWSAMRDPGIF